MRDVFADIYMFNHCAQSGVVLDSLDQALAEHGLMVPLDLGAKVMIMTLDCCVSCEMFASLERNKLN